MKNQKTSTKIYLIIGIITLVLGGMIYVILRENSYVSIFVNKYFPLDYLKDNMRVLGSPLLKYYLPDFLWALSLSCGLHIIYNPKLKGSFLCTALVALLGLTFELLQFINIINGTGDIIDVTLYFLAGLTVNFINNNLQKGVKL